MVGQGGGFGRVGFRSLARGGRGRDAVELGEGIDREPVLARLEPLADRYADGEDAARHREHAEQGESQLPRADAILHDVLKPLEVSHGASK
jgi:hypothetical protein